MRLGGDNDKRSTVTLVPVVKGFAGIDLMHASLCIQKSSNREGGSMRREVREGRNEFVPELPGLSARYRGPCVVCVWDRDAEEIRVDSNEMIDVPLMRPIAVSIRQTSYWSMIVRQEIIGKCWEIVAKQSHFCDCICIRLIFANYWYHWSLDVFLSRNHSETIKLSYIGQNMTPSICIISASSYSANVFVIELVNINS